MIITLQHLRKGKCCLSGTRRWFKTYNLDFTDFRKNGIDSEIIVKLNDPYGIKIVEIAKNGS